MAYRYFKHHTDFERIEEFDIPGYVTDLDLNWNKIIEISGLESFAELRKLQLQSCQIKEIKGLENVQLTYLDLGGNQVVVISGLEKQSELQILSLRENQITSMHGLQTLVKLRHINLNKNHIPRITSLEHLVLLEHLELGGNDICNIAGLDNLSSLGYLGLEHNNIEVIEGLDALTKLHALYLGNNPILKIQGLNNLTQLEWLSFRYCKISHIEGLDNLRRLSHLDVACTNISLVEGLENLTMLRSIDLYGTPLGAEALKKLLDYKRNGYLPGLRSVILEEKNLDLNDPETQDLLWALRKEYGVEVNDLSHNMVDFYLSRTENERKNHFSKVPTLLIVGDSRNLRQDIAKIEPEGFNIKVAGNSSTAVEIYSTLRDEIDLVIITGDTGDATKALMRIHDINPNVRVINRIDSEVGFENPEHRQYGVVAYTPSNYYAENFLDIIKSTLRLRMSSFNEELYKFLAKLFHDDDSKIADFFTELVSRYDIKRTSDMSIDQKGFTGKGVVKAKGGDVAIKIDKTERLRKEFRFYCAVSGTEFQEYCPHLYDPGYPENNCMQHENMGFLAMNDIDFQMHGLKKVNNSHNGIKILKHFGRPFTKAGMMYNIFLIALFHNASHQFDPLYRESLSLVGYEDPEGNPLHHTLGDPRGNVEGEAYKNWLKTRIPDGCWKIVEDYRQMLMGLHRQKQLIVVDGDWKPDNIYRGHKVDFSCVGFGLAHDDIAYFLSDFELKLGFDGFKHYVGKYLIFRSMVDSTFEPPRENDILLQQAWLTQLVLRHSVMNKRDLNDPKKYEERLYYQQRIKQAMQ